MKKIRFMANNFLESTFTYSSQKTGFPASNATNTSRSKVWRPAGNFEITSSNNSIYINDGSNKTVTLTSGSYTYSSLATHVQTQLNASSSSWTCTYSTTTNKFTIARSSGTRIMRFSQTTSAAWDTLGYTQTADTTGSPSSFIADEARIHTSEWLKCDMGVAQEATFAALIGPIDSVFTLSSAATVKVQASNLDSWAAPPVDVTVPVGSAAMKMLDDDIGTAYRYWRIVIIDRLNPLGPEGLEIGYAYLGDHKTVTLSNIATGFSKSLVDASVPLQSESGALFFESRPRYLSISGAEIQLLNGTEYDELEQLFYDLGISTPFIVSIDPGTEVSRNLTDLTRLVVMSSPPQIQHIIRDYYTIQFEMREAF